MMRRYFTLIVLLTVCSVFAQGQPVGRWSGAPFSPIRIAGLKLWLDASAITGLNDGDAVGTWTDLSGNGNNATQATASKKPLYKTNIQNGKPAVQFDSVDDGMNTALTLTEPYTIFCVELPVGSGFIRTLNGVSGNTLVSGGRNDNTAFLGAKVSDYRAATVAGAHILELVVTTTGATYLVDGIDHTATSTNHSTFAIGLGPNSNVAEPANTKLLEIICYSGTVSSGDRGVVRAYLKAKWGTP